MSPPVAPPKSASRLLGAGFGFGACIAAPSPLPLRSPLAAEALNARPYAFLDDAPLEERRTQAVQSRRYVDPESADDLGQLDLDAIDSVREEAWPAVRSVDEMHEALNGLCIVTDKEAAANAEWPAWLEALAKSGRATRLVPAGSNPSDTGLWVVAERLAQVAVIYPDAARQPAIEPPAEYAHPLGSSEEALRELLRSRLSGLGPMTADDLAAQLLDDGRSQIDRRSLPPPRAAEALRLTRRRRLVDLLSGCVSPKFNLSPPKCDAYR